MDNTAKFEAFLNYDFDHDDKFQSGLPSILLRAEHEPDRRDDIMDRAKWFYYNKFVEPFDYDEYLAWKKGSSSTNEEANVPKKLSFQELAELIEAGKPIPGIRQIPNKINEGKPSEPKMPVRKKPWEKD